MKLEVSPTKFLNKFDRLTTSLITNRIVYGPHFGKQRILRYKINKFTSILYNNIFGSKLASIQIKYNHLNFQFLIDNPLPIIN